MKLRDMFVVVVAATVTVGSIGLVGPKLVQAKGKKTKETRTKLPPQPVLKAKGLELSLELDKKEYKAGEVPQATLVVKNTGKESVTTKVGLKTMVDAPGMRMSRRMPIPTTAWSKELTITVAPGETKTIALKTAKVIPGSGRVVIQVGPQTLVSAWFRGPTNSFDRPLRLELSPKATKAPATK